MIKKKTIIIIKQLFTNILNRIRCKPQKQKVVPPNLDRVMIEKQTRFCCRSPLTPKNNRANPEPLRKTGSDDIFPRSLYFRGFQWTLRALRPVYVLFKCSRLYYVYSGLTTKKNNNKSTQQTCHDLNLQSPGSSN